MRASVILLVLVNSLFNSLRSGDQGIFYPGVFPFLPACPPGTGALGIDR